MDDAVLKRVAEAATPGPWRVVTDEDGYDFIVSATHGLVTTPERDDHPDGRYLATFDPPTVLGLLSRLSAAEARVGVLEEALRPSAATKFTYAGEFSFQFGDHTPNVPWVTIKEIMTAIRAFADNQALTQEPSHEPE
jgi:hypothetical protein